MRKRPFIALMGTILVGSVLALPAFGHHDDGKGNVSPPPMEVQEHEFENVVAASAAEDSKAPNSHAPCIRGESAKTFECDGIDMLSHLTLADLGLGFANDMWGWTDPQTRKDYAIVGGIEGTVFVDISDPKRPDIVGTLPAHTIDTFLFWRDIKVYEDHAFVGSESVGHGMQVFDLTRLRGVEGDPVTFDNDAHYDEFARSHNLAINEDTGFLYAVGTQTCSGGLHMVDISDPVDPTFAGCFDNHGYIHDTQCVIYSGPDAEHNGKEICFNSAADASEEDPLLNTVSIVDVTDKANPVELSRMGYDSDGYSHQGWLTPDQRYFLHNDELDEAVGAVDSTITRVWDVSDLDDLVMLHEVAHDTTSIGHNAYTEGDYLYASNYTAGLRVYDTTQLAEGVMEELAFFDVYPENDNTTFEGGTWSNYPYFHQKKIVAVSSMDRGLFVLQPRLGN